MKCSPTQLFFVKIQILPSKYSSWWRRLQDASSSPTSSEDVMKTSWSRPMYSYWPYVFKTSSRRFEDISKTSSRHLQYFLQRRLQQHVLQKCLQDIFKASCKDVFKTFSRSVIRLHFLLGLKICLLWPV